MVKWRLDESLRELVLIFDKNEGLKRVEMEVYASRAFWSDYTTEDVEKAHAEQVKEFAALVDHNTTILGSPNYAGAWGTPGYPEDQTAGFIVYWDRTGNRMQLERDRPDKEFPFTVRAASYPVRYEARE